MKKLLLSLTVIALFIFYSIYKQNNSSLLVSPIVPTTPPQDIKQGEISPIAVSSGQYKDGVYTGDTVDVFYGNVQVQAIIQNGKISDVKFLQSPNDRRTSIEINSQAMPMLKSEAIKVQSANVDGVSGATATSQGFVASLGSALVKAK